MEKLSKDGGKLELGAVGLLPGVLRREVDHLGNRASIFCSFVCVKSVERCRGMVFIYAGMSFLHHLR